MVFRGYSRSLCFHVVGFRGTSDWGRVFSVRNLFRGLHPTINFNSSKSCIATFACCEISHPYGTYFRVGECVYAEVAGLRQPYGLSIKHCPIVKEPTWSRSSYHFDLTSELSPIGEPSRQEIPLTNGRRDDEGNCSGNLQPSGISIG